MVRKIHFRMGDLVLCALPNDKRYPYVNKPGVVCPALVVRVDNEEGTYIQASVAPGDIASAENTIGFYGKAATDQTEGMPGTFWQRK